MNKKLKALILKFKPVINFMPFNNKICWHGGRLDIDRSVMVHSEIINYGNIDENVSAKVVKLIQSYTSIIDRIV